jgi:hypothetical protein
MSTGFMSSGIKKLLMTFQHEMRFLQAVEKRFSHMEKHRDQKRASELRNRARRCGN